MKPLFVLAALCFGLPLWSQNIRFLGEHLPERHSVSIPREVRHQLKRHPYLLLEIQADPALASTVISWAQGRAVLFESSVFERQGTYRVVLPFPKQDPPSRLTFTSQWNARGTLQISRMSVIEAPPGSRPLHVPPALFETGHDPEDWTLCLNERQQWRVVETAEPPPAGATRIKPEAENGMSLLWDFTRITGRWGRLYGRFQGRGAEVTLRQTRGALEVSGTGTRSGFGGVWIQIQPSRGLGLELLDASALPFLNFQIHAGKGAGGLAVQLADETWMKKDDSLPVGRLSDFASLGDEPGWTTACIPLRREGLDLSGLTSLVLNLTGMEDTQFVLGAIYLSDRPGRVLAYPAMPLEDFSAEKPGPAGLFVWDTLLILDQGRKGAARLLDLLDRWNIGTVYLQLPYRLHTEPDAAWARGRTARRLRRLLAALHASGIEVHALDGWKGFARDGLHDRIIAQARRVIGFNAGLPAEARFNALHLDVEPYLLHEFVGRGRQTVMAEYVRMLEKVKGETGRAGLPLVADLPFWYDTLPEGTAWLGRIARAVDAVVIMAYRTDLWGGNGILRQVEPEVRILGEAGRIPVLGFETMSLPPEDYFKISSGSADPRYKLVRLEEAAQPLYFIAGPEAEGKGVVLAYATPEAAISFHGRTTEEFRRTLRAVRGYFGPSIGGLALHHYGSLLTRDPAGDQSKP